MENNKFALVLMTDDNYVKYALPMVSSFISFNSWFDGDIILLYDDDLIKLSEENRKKFECLYKNVKYHKVDREKYRWLQERYFKATHNNHWLTVYYKYEIFNMLQYDKILYLDSDMIINHSLKELFDANLSFACVSEHKNKVYLNAGLMYLGNKTYINEETFNGILNFTKEKPPYIYPEQDALNLYFSDKKHEILLQKFNYMLHIRGNMDLKIEDAYIIHFTALKAEGYPMDSFERQVFEREKSSLIYN